MALVYSFDVFDTALVRRVALPTDIFRLTARAIAADDAGLTEFEEAFVSARIAAEQIARAAAAPAEDCTIDAIWTELRRLMPGLPESATSATEVAVESANIGANPHLAPRIRALQAAGERVIFISDIFYTRETVFALLSDAGLATRIEQVHVSSETGLLKATGRLFRHVAEAEGISPTDLRHTGDHPVSDGSAARAHGAQSTVYHTTRLNGAEHTVLRAYGSDMTGSRLAAAMRLARLSTAADGKAGLVAAYLGPMAVLQAAWALRQAQQRDIRKAYFVARDGYVPWRAATALAPAFPAVTARYVKLSRHSLVAAMPQLGEFGVFWIDRSWSKRSVAEIAALIGHGWEDIEGAVTQAIPHAARDYLLASPAEMRRFVEVLDAAPSTGENGRQREARRAAALAYMRSEAMLDAEPFLLFDVGWYLNMQAAVKAVLDQSGATGFRGGLYLGLCNGRVGEELAGPARALLYEKPYVPDRPSGTNTVFERIILIEHLMGLAPHGSAKGYADMDGRPDAIEGPISAQRQATVQAISDEVATFATSLTSYAQELGNEESARRAIEALTNHFLATPHAYDLSYLDQLEVESDSGSAPVVRIAEPWAVSSVALQAVPYRIREKLRLSHGPTLWPEASLARSGGAQRSALKLLKRTRRIAGRLLRRGAAK